jgi:inward rectifier potassium channel
MKTRLRNRELLVRRIGVEESLLGDLYHRLLRLTWLRFFLLILLIFISVNIFFGSLYYAFLGSVANVNDFLSSFFFSVETFATIGYGYFYPQTTVAHILVTAEVAFGMFSTAVLTGIVFAKFARPQARVVFSDNILFTSQNGKPVLSLRLGNIRTNRVFEGRAQLTLLRDEVSTEGEKLRRLINLKLQRNETPLFVLSWTLFHLIDQDSPLFGVTPGEMANLGWEIYATFTGLDQDMAQNIVAHSTYQAEKIIRARKFVDMIRFDNGTRIIDFSKLHDVEL